MAGRRPKPTAIKLVTGNPGKRPLNRSEPKPEGEVSKPAFVKYRATRIWKQYAPELIRLGVLKATDSHMFGTWCCLMAEFEEAPRAFNAARLTQLRALSASFGLDPSSRSRINVPEPPADPDGERYFD